MDLSGLFDPALFDQLIYRDCFSREGIDQSCYPSMSTHNERFGGNRIDTGEDLEPVSEGIDLARYISQIAGAILDRLDRIVFE